jgi:hypothetical protein
VLGGGLLAAPEAEAAVNNFAAGNTAKGVRASLLGGIDAAAGGFPSIPTFALAAGAHAIDAGARSVGDEKIAGTLNQISRNAYNAAPTPSGAPVNDDAELKANARSALLANPNTPAATLKLIGEGRRPAAAATPGGGNSQDAAAEAELNKTLADLNNKNNPASPLAPDVKVIDPTKPATLAQRPKGPGDQTAAEALASTAPGTAVINGRVIQPEEIKALANRNVISAQNFTHPGLGIGQNVTDAQGVAVAGRAASGGADEGPQRLPGLTGGIGAKNPNQGFDDLIKQIREYAGATGAGAGSKRRSARALIDLLGQLGGQQRTLLEHQVATAPKPESAAQQELLTSEAQELRQRGEFYGGEAAKRTNIAQLQDQLATETDPAARQILEGKLAAAYGKVVPETKAQAYHTVRLPDGSSIPVAESDLPMVYKKLLDTGAAVPAGK